MKEAELVSLKQTTFYIEGMDCPTEERLIRNRLRGVAGVEELSFNLMTREVTISHRFVDEVALVSALESIGMAPRPAPPEPAPDALQESIFALPGMC